MEENEESQEGAGKERRESSSHSSKVISLGEGISKKIDKSGRLREITFNIDEKPELAWLAERLEDPSFKQFISSLPGLNGVSTLQGLIGNNKIERAWYASSDLYPLDKMVEHIKFGEPLTNALRIYYFSQEAAYYRVMGLNLDFTDPTIDKKLEAQLDLMKKTCIREGEQAKQLLEDKLRGSIFKREPDVRLSPDFTGKYAVLFDALKKDFKEHKGSPFYWATINATRQLLGNYGPFTESEEAWTAKLASYLMTQDLDGGKLANALATELKFKPEGIRLFLGHIDVLKDDTRKSPYVKEDAVLPENVGIADLNTVYKEYKKKIELAANFALAIAAKAIDVGERYDYRVCPPEQAGIDGMIRVIMSNQTINANIVSLLGRSFPELKQIPYTVPTAPVENINPSG